MSVSGIDSTGANYPALPPINGIPAFSYIALGVLSDIAGALAAKGIKEA
ncbi:MAG: hypothetical protein ACRDFB_02650 [Rhabdochlamydiaceae bacterium]